MRSRLIGLAACLSVLGGAAPSLAQTEVPKRHNPVIDLLEQGRPVFGLYASSNRRPGPPGAPVPSAVPPRTPAELARDALANKSTDYIFDGTMEGDFENAYPGFASFAKGMSEAGALARTPVLRLTHPLFVKMNEIAPDPSGASERIGRQLNLGVSGVVFVGVESADEVKTGLAAMRFRSKGGTRGDEAGAAPTYWGMTDKEYHEKADLWPLNPKGELMNWTIVESEAGLARVREIAAVPGIGVLFPGAGTLRGVFSSTNSRSPPHSHGFSPKRGQER